MPLSWSRRTAPYINDGTCLVSGGFLLRLLSIFGKDPSAFLAELISVNAFTNLQNLNCAYLHVTAPGSEAREADQGMEDSNVLCIASSTMSHEPIFLASYLAYKISAFFHSRSPISPALSLSRRYCSVKILTHLEHSAISNKVEIVGFMFELSRSGYVRDGTHYYRLVSGVLESSCRNISCR
jgi:hypothetical protein